MTCLRHAQAVVRWKQLQIPRCHRIVAKKPKPAKHKRPEAQRRGHSLRKPTMPQGSRRPCLQVSTNVPQKRATVRGPRPCGIERKPTTCTTNSALREYCAPHQRRSWMKQKHFKRESRGNPRGQHECLIHSKSNLGTTPSAKWPVQNTVSTVRLI